MIRIDRIEALMEALGLNPLRAAKKAGLGPDYVRDLVRGKVKQPSASRLRNLARVLGTSPEFLMGDTDDPAGSSYGNYEATPAKLPVRHAIKVGYFPLSAVPQPTRESSQWLIEARSAEDEDEWIEEVLDSQLNGLIPVGSYVHVANYTGNLLTDGMAFVFEHLRDSGTLLGRSIRRVSRSDAYGVSFWPGIAGIEAQECTLEALISGENSLGLKIAGIVLQSYLLYPDDSPF